MEIIKSYWSNKKEQEISENSFLEYNQNFEIKNVFIGFEQIKNFKISFEKSYNSDKKRMILNYALRKNAKLKYYCNLLNHSIAVNENTIVFLQDKNWHNYKTKTLNKETLNILKNI